MSSAAIIGCYPALCASLQLQGVSASRLVLLGSRMTGLLGADVVATHQMTSSRGKTLVRVVQASLKQDSVTVSYGSRLPAKQLTFSSVTPCTAVSPGVHTVKFAASGEHTTMSLGLTADTVHTIVVLDGPSGLKADELTDAVGTAVMPKGGAATGSRRHRAPVGGGSNPVAAVVAGGGTHHSGRHRARLATSYSRNSPAGSRRVAAHVADQAHDVVGDEPPDGAA